jgi:two-component system phosphate regulon response regulator OmpR
LNSDSQSATNFAPKKSVLVIEDNHPCALYYKTVLENNNYAVSTSNNAFEAEQLIEKTQYDLIITDVLLPGMRGDDLAQRLKSTGVSTPIIGITGLVESYFNSAVFDDYIIKPVLPEAFLQKVQQYLN